MKSQVLHTVWCNISGGAGGEIWNWSVLGVKGLKPGSHMIAAIATIADNLSVPCLVCERLWNNSDYIRRDLSEILFMLGQTRDWEFRG